LIGLDIHTIGGLMGFFKKISQIFGSSGRPDSSSYWVAVKCNRCGEQITARIDLRNDLSIEYGEGNSSPTFFCRKLLIGEGGRCFQRIEIELTFDTDKYLINREISGGQFINE